MGYFKAKPTQREKKRKNEREADNLMKKRFNSQQYGEFKNGIVDKLAKDKFNKVWENLYPLFFIICRKNRVGEERAKVILNELADALLEKLNIKDNEETEVKE